MRLPPEFLEAVAFLCTEGPEKRPGGTAFFVSLRDDITRNIEWMYLVSARHNLEEMPGQDVFVRLSTADGAGFQHQRTRKDDWFKHDDADVAVIPFPYKGWRFRSFPLYMFINKNYEYVPHEFGQNYERAFLKRYGRVAVPIELGDELFFPGLFIQSAGAKRNLPIYRFGNISRMPGDAIYLDTKARGEVAIRAYLIEARSWGGHGGSPTVWFHIFHPQEHLSADEREMVSNPRLHLTGLLGLVSAHFDVPIPTTGGEERLETKVNSGIAVVTPAENIRELLMRQDVVDERKYKGASK